MLKRLKVLKERVTSDSKAEPSRGTTLHNASQNQIKKIAKAFGHIDGIIEVKEGFKKVNKATRKAIVSENH